jgi:hypothetical protein
LLLTFSRIQHLAATLLQMKSLEQEKPRKKL